MRWQDCEFIFRSVKFIVIGIGGALVVVRVPDVVPGGPYGHPLLWPLKLHGLHGAHCPRRGAEEMNTKTTIEEECRKV